MTESELDEIFGRIEERGLAYRSDPARIQAGEINRHDRARGVHFELPSGHLFEIITKLYGSDG